MLLEKLGYTNQYLYLSHLFIGINLGVFGSSNINSMKEDDKEEDDKEHQRQVKEKEEVEKCLLEKSQAEHLLRQEDEQCQEREAPQDNRNMQALKN